MRIPSGVTDQYIYFVAVDATDFTTRETALSSFTVYRSRNGAAAAVFTTPTINETDVTNMPGVYELLLDEDMTIDSGDDSQEFCLHITHAGMAPVTRTFELYRPKITAGEALTVASGRGNADVTHIATAAVNTASAQIGVNVVNLGASATPVTNLTTVFSTDFAANYDTTNDVWKTNATHLAGQVITAAAGVTFPASIASPTNITAGVITTVTNLTNAPTNGDLTTVMKASINTEADTALTDYDAPTSAELVSEINSVQTDITALNNITAASVWAVATRVLTAATNISGPIADQVWEEAIADHSGTVGSTAEQLAAAGSAGDPWATPLPGAYGSGTAGKIVGDNVNATISSRSTQTSVDGIQIDTDDIQTRLPAALVGGRIDSNVGTINNIATTSVTTINANQGTTQPLNFTGTAGLAKVRSDVQAWAANSAGMSVDLNNLPLVSTGSFHDLIGGVSGLVELTGNVNLDLIQSIQSDTDNIQTRLPTALVGGRMDSSIGAMATNTLTASALATDAVTEIQTGLSTLTEANVRTAVGLASANLDTQLGIIVADTNELQTDWVNGGRLDLLLDSILADTGTDGVVLSTATLNQIADALLDRAAGVETNRTPRQALRLILSSAAGKLSGAATANVKIRDTNDTLDRIDATVDISGNRTAVTLNAG